jgi:hypothetical protein
MGTHYMNTHPKSARATITRLTLLLAGLIALGAGLAHAQITTTTPGAIAGGTITPSLSDKPFAATVAGPNPVVGQSAPGRLTINNNAVLTVAGAFIVANNLGTTDRATSSAIRKATIAAEAKATAEAGCTSTNTATILAGSIRNKAKTKTPYATNKEKLFRP